MQKAVLAFQKTNALPENGMVDGTMLMAMNAATAFGKSIENWKLGLSVLRLMVHDFYDSVADVQDLLFKLDYVDKQTATTTKPPGTRSSSSSRKTGCQWTAWWAMPPTTC